MVTASRLSSPLSLFLEMEENTGGPPKMKQPLLNAGSSYSVNIRSGIYNMRSPERKKGRPKVSPRGRLVAMFSPRRTQTSRLPDDSIPLPPLLHTEERTQPVASGTHILVKAGGRTTFYRDGRVVDCKQNREDTSWILIVRLGLSPNLREDQTMELKYPPVGNEYYFPEAKTSEAKVGLCGFIAVPCSKRTLQKSFRRVSKGEGDPRLRNRRGRHKIKMSEPPASPFASNKWSLSTDSKAFFENTSSGDGKDNLDAIRGDDPDDRFFAWLPGFITSVGHGSLHIEISDVGDGATYDAKYYYPARKSVSIEHRDVFLSAVYAAGNEIEERERPVVVALPHYLRDLRPLEEATCPAFVKGKWLDTAGNGVSANVVSENGRIYVKMEGKIGVTFGDISELSANPCSPMAARAHKLAFFTDNTMKTRIWIFENPKMSRNMIGWNIDFKKSNRLALHWIECRGEKRMVWIRSFCRHTWDSWIVGLFRGLFSFGKISTLELMGCLDECLGLRLSTSRYGRLSLNGGGREEKDRNSYTPTSACGKDSELKRSYRSFRRTKWIRSREEEILKHGRLLLSVKKNLLTMDAVSDFKGYALYDLMEKPLDFDQFCHCFINSSKFLNMHSLASTDHFANILESGLSKLQKEEKNLTSKLARLSTLLETSQFNAWLAKQLINDATTAGPPSPSSNVLDQFKFTNRNNQARFGYIRTEPSRDSDDRSQVKNSPIWDESSITNPGMALSLQRLYEYYKAESTLGDGKIALRNVHPLARGAARPCIAPSIDSVLTHVGGDTRESKDLLLRGKIRFPFESQIPDCVDLEVYKECLHLALNYASTGIEGERRGSILVLGIPDDLMKLGQIPKDNAFDKRLEHKLTVLSRMGRDRVRRKMNLDGMIIVDGRTGRPCAHEFFSRGTSDLVHDGGARTRAAAWMAEKASCVVIKISADTDGEISVYLGRPNRGTEPQAPQREDVYPPNRGHRDGTLDTATPTWKFGEEEERWYVQSILEDVFKILRNNQGKYLGIYGMEKAWKSLLDVIWHLIKQADCNRDGRLDVMEEFVVLHKLFPADSECKTLFIRRHIAEMHRRDRLFSEEELNSKVQAIQRAIRTKSQTKREIKIRKEGRNGGWNFLDDTLCTDDAISIFSEAYWTCSIPRGRMPHVLKVLVLYHKYYRFAAISDMAHWPPFAPLRGRNVHSSGIIIPPLSKFLDPKIQALFATEVGIRSMSSLSILTAWSRQDLWDPDNSYALADAAALARLQGKWIIPKSSENVPVLQEHIKSFHVSQRERGMRWHSGQFFSVYSRNSEGRWRYFSGGWRWDLDGNKLSWNKGALTIHWTRETPKSRRSISRVDSLDVFKDDSEDKKINLYQAPFTGKLSTRSLKLILPNEKADIIKQRATNMLDSILRLKHRNKALQRLVSTGIEDNTEEDLLSCNSTMSSRITVTGDYGDRGSDILPATDAVRYYAERMANRINLLRDPRGPIFIGYDATLIDKFATAIKTMIFLLFLPFVVFRFGLRNITRKKSGGGERGRRPRERLLVDKVFASLDLIPEIVEEKSTLGRFVKGTHGLHRVKDGCLCSRITGRLITNPQTYGQIVVVIMLIILAYSSLPLLVVYFALHLEDQPLTPPEVIAPAILNIVFFGILWVRLQMLSGKRTFGSKRTSLWLETTFRATLGETEFQDDCTRSSIKDLVNKNTLIHVNVVDIHGEHRVEPRICSEVAEEVFRSTGVDPASTSACIPSFLRVCIGGGCWEGLICDYPQAGAVCVAVVHTLIPPLLRVSHGEHFFGGSDTLLFYIGLMSLILNFVFAWLVCLQLNHVLITEASHIGSVLSAVSAITNSEDAMDIRIDSNLSSPLNVGVEQESIWEMETLLHPNDKYPSPVEFDILRGYSLSPRRKNQKRSTDEIITKARYSSTRLGGKIYLELNSAANIRSWLRLRQVVFLHSTTAFLGEIGYIFAALVALEAILVSLIMAATINRTQYPHSNAFIGVPLVGIFDSAVVHLYIVVALATMARANKILKVSHAATLSKAKYTLMMQRHLSDDDNLKRRRLISMLDVARECIRDDFDPNVLTLRIWGSSISYSIVYVAAALVTTIFVVAVISTSL
ncbi:hypothetical protein AAMO2058_000549300 [Amorphochlora amoebiformis]